MGLRTGLLGLFAVVLAAPLQAQSTPIPATPEEDLRCAAWAAVVLGINKDNTEVAAGFGMALAWFAARYEGATGKTFEEAMTAEYLDRLTPELQAIEETCKPRMQEIGQRFSDWGTKLGGAQ